MWWDEGENPVAELGIRGSDALVLLILFDAHVRGQGWMSLTDIARAANMRRHTLYHKLQAMSLACYRGWCVVQDVARPTHWRLLRMDAEMEGA